MKLSVVISAYNEEQKIKDCLESVRWADEIILVDNSSSDKTVPIAKKYTSKIFTRSNNRMLNINKNYGFSKATGDWILCLDADERITPELKEELLEKLKNDNTSVHGFWIPRKNIIFGKWIQHAGWYPDFQLRLFKKNLGRFDEEHVHEMIHVVGETEQLKNPMIHYNYESVDQFLKKLSTIYTTNEAEQFLKKGYHFNYLDAIRFPLKEFLSRFFAREGYKDGLHGLILSMMMGFYHFIVFAKIWERQKFVEINKSTFMNAIERETYKSGKDILYWYTTEKIKKATNPFSSFGLKVKRKMSNL